MLVVSSVINPILKEEEWTDLRSSGKLEFHWIVSKAVYYRDV